MTRPRRRRRWLVAVIAVVAVAAAAWALLWFFGGDEPDAVDAERALQQDQDGLSDVFVPDLDAGDTDENDDGDGRDPDGAGDDDEGDDSTGPDVPDVTDEDADEDDGDDGDDGDGGDDGRDPDDGDADGDGDDDRELPAPESAEDLDGVWIVDTSREFDRASGRGTFVGYRIEEELSGIGSSTAVGRSPVVDGEVVFDGATVTSAMIEGDLTALESDDVRRDRRVRSTLGPAATARFELSERIELPEVPPVNEVIELTVSGTLTLLEESREVEVGLQAVVTDTGLLVTGSTIVLLSDYDVEVPSAPIVLSASDQATIEWQVFLTKED